MDSENEGKGRSDVRVDHHDLAQLTMRSRGAVDEHGLRVGDCHLKGRHCRLASSERDVPAVHGSRLARDGLDRCTRLHLGALCDCVVARTELELDNVSWGSNDHVWHVGHLSSAHHHWDDNRGSTRSAGSRSRGRGRSRSGRLSPGGKVLVD